MILSRKPFYVTKTGVAFDVRIISALGANPTGDWDYILKKKSLDPNVDEELTINIAPFCTMVFNPIPPQTKLSGIEIPVNSNHSRTKYQLDGVQYMEDNFYGWKDWQFDDTAAPLPFSVKTKVVTKDSWQFLELSTVQLGADVTWTTDNGNSVSEALPTTVAMVHVPVIPDALDLTGATSIRITDTSGKLDVIYSIQCSWEQESRTIFFMNAYGVWESFDVIGSENYIAERESSGSLSYADGSYTEYSITGTSSIKVNTGWVNFEFKELINQLMMSENIYLIEEGKVLPVYMKDSSFNYKSRRSNNLINHALTFTYSKPVIPIV